MAQIVTITNPLTGQPAQVDQLEHTAQEIDDAVARALPGGAIDTALQNKLGGIESTDYPGCYYRMVDGVVEWFNPPMQVGDEYRTTERYLGKPVYTMAVDFGALPVDTYKIVGHNIANVDCMLSACGVIPEIGTQIPGKSIANGFWKNDIDVLSDRSNIQVVTRNCNDHLKNDGWTAQITLRYTKTTD